MFKLIFQDSLGRDRVIAENLETEDLCREEITKFLESNNYKSYAWRMWKNPTNPNETLIDVGSHSEFFRVVFAG